MRPHVSPLAASRSFAGSATVTAPSFAFAERCNCKATTNEDFPEVGSPTVGSSFAVLLFPGLGLNAEQELTDTEDQLRSPTRRETTVSTIWERTSYLGRVDTQSRAVTTLRHEEETCLLVLWPTRTSCMPK